MTPNDAYSCASWLHWCAGVLVTSQTIVSSILMLIPLVSSQSPHIAPLTVRALDGAVPMLLRSVRCVCFLLIFFPSLSRYIYHIYIDSCIDIISTIVELFHA